MRFILPCIQCGMAHLFESSFVSLNFNDSGIYEFKCKNGHESIVILQEKKFEILFDIGAYAILDGYYREAVSSFSAALERFYEYAIRVILAKNSVIDDAFLQTWKKVSNQSERQLGAFYYLWVLNFNEAPVMLSDTDSGFRNSVIHKGLIPSRERTIDYGEKVLNIIRPMIKRLKEELRDEMTKVNTSLIGETRAKSNKSSITTAVVTTIISTTYEEDKHFNTSLVDFLKRYTKLIEFHEKNK
ncbi:hypothetical protein [Serratia fonticola]|uniref:hypothetical protein n=1 Tax=Serratia fonticola TaxID=47917 RepID=UPI0034C5F840